MIKSTAYEVEREARAKLEEELLQAKLEQSLLNRRDQIFGMRARGAVFVAVGGIVSVFGSSLIQCPHDCSDDSWIMFVAPIASITVMTATLLFGAFRRFRENDLGKLNNRVAKGATLARAFSAQHESRYFPIERYSADV